MYRAQRRAPGAINRIAVKRDATARHVAGSGIEHPGMAEDLKFDVGDTSRWVKSGEEGRGPGFTPYIPGVRAVSLYPYLRAIPDQGEATAGAGGSC